MCDFIKIINNIVFQIFSQKIENDTLNNRLHINHINNYMTTIYYINRDDYTITNISVNPNILIKDAARFIEQHFNLEEYSIKINGCNTGKLNTLWSLNMYDEIFFTENYSGHLIKFPEFNLSLNSTEFENHWVSKLPIHNFTKMVDDDCNSLYMINDDCVFFCVTDHKNKVYNTVLKNSKYTTIHDLLTYLKYKPRAHIYLTNGNIKLY